MKRILRRHQGYLSTPWGRVWYERVGGGAGLPLITAHGGPGYPHDSFEPLSALGVDRPVIFYDQLGCGRSDRPTDRSLWTIDRFVEELGMVADELVNGPFHLLGHSWGSMLATDYALTRPLGLRGLILASPPLCIPRWLEDLERYRAALPEDIRDVLTRHEAGGTTDSEEYEEATLAFYRRHLCRLDPWPEELNRAMEGASMDVYHTMWGPSEFYMTGSLADYDRTDRLSEITSPTLFTCGAYDEAPPETTRWYQSLLPGSRLAVFEQSAHLPHLEEPDAYLRALGKFLSDCDNSEEDTAK